MSVERALRGIAGAFVLAGVGLMVFHSPRWTWFLVLVGVMLLQSGFTDRCPMMWLLEKAGLRRCEAQAPAGSTRPLQAEPRGGVR